ncbi:4-carboxymuconolactone decarboxylase [Mycena belliarum]|uniref:4-carboxymuconolactone decarboxylase n=1 Tax=Mycena belliarum TaxID=1033014 RepID=A0AAD6XRW0_9AGAR|nr:4-carboxymuconolactone decarboxylase [Mycena belliae]
MTSNALSLLFALFAAVFAVASGSAFAEVQPRDENLPARVPYVFPRPGTNQIADDIRSRRENGTLLALDGALLNAPLVAQGWNQLFTVIRENLTIPADMRELFILRTAVINNAAYQWGQHESVGRAEGLTTRQLRVLRFAPEGACSFADQKILGDRLAAALDFADAIGTSVRVPTHVYKNLARFLSPQQMVEAAATAGGYAFVSRFTVSLNVDGKMNAEVPVP